MKTLVCLMGAVGIMISSLAQEAPIKLTTDKTTTLVFPYPVRHVDRGTKNILLLPVKEMDQILLVKAAGRGFPPTNLSVVTADGSVYSLDVCYGETDTLVHYLPAKGKAPLSVYTKSILDNPPTVVGVRDASWGAVASVKGIYTAGDALFFQIHIRNGSTVDYAIDELRFFIRDRKGGKRTAIQERELKPLHTEGTVVSVGAGDETVIAIALAKFTIPAGQYLAIQIREKEGGRNLLLKVNNRRIVHATPLPDVK